MVAIGELTSFQSSKHPRVKCDNRNVSFIFPSVQDNSDKTEYCRNKKLHAFTKIQQ